MQPKLPPNHKLNSIHSQTNWTNGNMICKLCIIVVIVKIYEIDVTQSQFSDSELVYHKPKREKTNIMNKGVWIRNNVDTNDLTDKIKAGNFIFRENSMDIDSLVQNNFDAFGGSSLPFVPVYADRQKRSSRYRRPRQSIMGKNIRPRQNTEYENTDASKNVNNPKLNQIFNSYPYDVAILLTGNASDEKNLNSEMGKTEIVNSIKMSNSLNNNTVDELTAVSIGTESKNTSDDSNKNINSSKRSMKYDFETEIIKKIEFTEDINRTEENDNSDSKVNDRNVFDKENSEWHQSAPIPDINIYKVVPKEPVQKSKPVTERGLIKVISMLTKTFKKILKQHNEIKDIHSKVNEVSEDFKKNIAPSISKFQDFDLKYLYLVKLHDHMKEFETKLDNREQYFLNKEKDIANGLKEFENQQKKFLLQQKQFYNIQKLMLAQNEKINAKQNAIAKTQSEISQRQNNFARILKKAKQLYTDSRHPAITKLSSSISKVKETTQKPPEVKMTQTTTKAPEPTTDSIKINLFSIPASNKIQQDPDELILKEKDEQAIDDLVYKYYFNNTFIDNLMRNTVLNTFMGNGESSGNVRIAKNKRDDYETTILLPVQEPNEEQTYGHNRERRWINRHQSRHLKRKEHRKTTPTVVVTTTDTPKPLVIPMNVDMPLNILENYPEKRKEIPYNPFLTMANNFCNAIHQNSNQQVLGWCIEKALRKLQYLEEKMVPISQPPQQPMPNFILSPMSVLKVNKAFGNQENPTVDKNLLPVNEHIVKKVLPNAIETTTQTPATNPGSDATTASPVQLTSITLQTIETAYSNLPAALKITADAFNFPDNDELELNLKEYELKPDLEGNVYFDGSFHESDLKAAHSDSGADDVMPGLDSNSRIQVDPLTFDIQAQRRAFMRKLNHRKQVR